jgi:RES domain-containing protein
LTVWRIEKRQYVETALTGEGARVYGGRWNSSGRRAVYASATLSLSALEKLVHLDRPGVRGNFLAIGIQLPARAVDDVELETLPRNWSKELDFASTRRIGDDWLAENRSVVLAVPSALISRERNFVLNPDHPDYGQVRITIQEPFVFDPRLAS